MFDFDQEAIDAIILAADRPNRAKQHGCTSPDRALALALFSHPATTEGLAEMGVKLIQTNKSFTLKFEKGSGSSRRIGHVVARDREPRLARRVGWDKFLEGAAAMLKKMATKKQMSLLKKYLK